jgi:hypothetical protein
MLRVMLDQHPEMAIPPESYWPLTLWRRKARYESDDGFDVERFADDLVANEGFRNFRLDGSELRERLQAEAPAGYPDAVRAVYAEYARSVGKSRFGDKTPPFVLHMDLLAELFPEARFVHVIRDGRDVGLSLREAHFDAPRTVTGAARYWRDRVRRGRALGVRLSPDRYLELRYEDVVGDPRSTLARLCSFVELEFTDRMLDYGRRARATIRVQDRAHESTALTPPVAGLRDWRRQMPSRDVAAFEAVAGEVLSELGYARAFATPPVTARLRAGASTGAAEVSRAIRTTARRLRRRLDRR